MIPKEIKYNLHYENQSKYIICVNQDFFLLCSSFT